MSETEKTLNFRVDEKTAIRLDGLAHKERRTRANMIRVLVEHAVLDGDHCDECGRLGEEHKRDCSNHADAVKVRKVAVLPDPAKPAVVKRGRAFEVCPYCLDKDHKYCPDGKPDVNPPMWCQCAEAGHPTT